MSIDAVKTQTGARPDLAALPANGTVNYIGSLIYPIFRVFGKAGTYYYQALQADSTATTSRTVGAAPTAVTITESSGSFSATEQIKRYKIPYEAVPLLGGVEKADEVGGKAAKRSVLNALETAQLAELVDASGTSITSAIQDGIIDAADRLHRYDGRTAFVCNIGQYRWLIQQTEIRNMLVRTFGGLDAVSSLSITPAAFKSMLQTLFMVDDVLVADDKFWPYTYRTTAAVCKLPPQGRDNMSFLSDVELGRTMVYWPKDENEGLEINSFADDDIRANVYDAISWFSLEEFNDGAKALLTINTSGSTTAGA